MVYQESAIYKALEELDKRLSVIGINPFDLYVVGGFALMVNEIRPATDANQYTDIDYIGEDFDDEIRTIINKIGIEYKLGKNWLNSDVVMDGLDLEDLEYATGPLNFKKKLEMDVITVYALVPEDLIRMKVIAVDTSYMAWKDYGGEFTRSKDFEDIKALMEYLNWDIKKLRFETEDYVLNPSGCYGMINNYLEQDR